MKTKWTIITILLCNTGLYSQSNADYEKLSKACELWGLIKYFHTDKPGTEFDSAFAANVPSMLEAKNENDWRNVLTQWLSALNDSNTKIISDDKEKSAGGSYKSEFDIDSVLVVKIAGTELFEDFYEGYKFFETLQGQLTKSKKGIIFDLRQEASIPSHYNGFLDYLFEDVNKVLAADVVPQFKTIYYSGFKTEGGGSYSINDILLNRIQHGNFKKRNQKVVWIVNKYSELPIVALSQQASGVAAIFSDSENITELIPLSNTFNLSETLIVKFKTKELLFPNNFLPTIDYRYVVSENPIKIARTLLSNWIDPKKTGAENKPKLSSDNAIAYPHGAYPSIGYRILAAAKIFSVIEIFFPYYQLMDKDWRTVLVESLPDFINAKNEIEYGLAVAKMYANINDSHGFIRGNKGLDLLRGEAPSPVSVDWIENKVVITQFRNDSLCQANGINIGDVILKVNGISVDELIRKHEAYFAHSTKDYIRQWAAQYCIRGSENQEGIFTIQDRNGKSRDIKMMWSNSYNSNFTIMHKLDTFSLLNKKIGYADLTRMEAKQTDVMFEKFKNTKAIIFDMRGYPKGTAWTIAPRLTENEDVPLARFRKPEVLSPNIKNGEILSSKSFTEFVQTVETSDKWKYKGKTVMLINQNAISQSEHTGLFFESVNNTTFIGSPTAGANGDITRFQIPGGMFLTFSGQGVWHADGRQLQRVGLQPHVLVRPTIKGIRAGRDEQLEKAIEWINQNVK
jgi:C-terminal processing protease CtpA/Prc